VSTKTPFTNKPDIPLPKPTIHYSSPERSRSLSPFSAAFESRLGDVAVLAKMKEQQVKKERESRRKKVDAEVLKG
jgi:hypothetical protein